MLAHWALAPPRGIRDPEKAGTIRASRCSPALIELWDLYRNVRKDSSLSPV